MQHPFIVQKKSFHSISSHITSLVILNFFLTTIQCYTLNVLESWVRDDSHMTPPREKELLQLIAVREMIHSRALDTGH